MEITNCLKSAKFVSILSTLYICVLPAGGPCKSEFLNTWISFLEGLGGGGLVQKGPGQEGSRLARAGTMGSPRSRGEGLHPVGTPTRWPAMHPNPPVTGTGSTIACHEWIIIERSACQTENHTPNLNVPSTGWCWQCLPCKPRVLAPTAFGPKVDEPVRADTVRNNGSGEIGMPLPPSCPMLPAI